MGTEYACLLVVYGDAAYVISAYVINLSAVNVVPYWTDHTSAMDVSGAVSVLLPDSKWAPRLIVGTF